MLQSGRAVLAALAVLSASVFAQAAGQSFNIAPAGPPRTEIPTELRSDLESDGIRLSRTVNGVDDPLAELWAMKTLKVRRAGKSPSQVLYPQFMPGETLAVLYVSTPILDARLQKVPAGLYVLRYIRIDPEKTEDDEEGDDQDRPLPAEYRDYVFLARLAPGAQTAADPPNAKMMKLSRQGAKKEPALLALPPLNPAYKIFPYAVSDDLGHCALQFKLSVRLTSGQKVELPIAILLVNPPDFSADD